MNNNKPDKLKEDIQQVNDRLQNLNNEVRQLNCLTSNQSVPV